MRTRRAARPGGRGRAGPSRRSTTAARPLTAARTRRRGVSARQAVDALNPRPERAQPLVDPLVAPVDLADVADRRHAFGAQARDQHGHAGADVRALQPLAVSFAGPATTTRCGSQTMIRAPMPTSLSTKNRRLSNIFSKIENRAARLGGDDDGDRGEVGREGRPGAVLDLRDLAAEVVLDRELLAGRDVDGSSLELDVDAEPLERGQDREPGPRAPRHRS